MKLTLLLFTLFCATGIDAYALPPEQRAAPLFDSSCGKMLKVMLESQSRAELFTSFLGLHGVSEEDATELLGVFRDKQAPSSRMIKKLESCEESGVIWLALCSHLASTSPNLQLKCASEWVPASTDADLGIGSFIANLDDMWNKPTAPLPTEDAFYPYLHGFTTPLSESELTQLEIWIECMASDEACTSTLAGAFPLTVLALSYRQRPQLFAKMWEASDPEFQLAAHWALSTIEPSPAISAYLARRARPETIATDPGEASNILGLMANWPNNPIFQEACAERMGLRLRFPQETENGRLALLLASRHERADGTRPIDDWISDTLALVDEVAGASGMPDEEFAAYMRRVKSGESAEDLRRTRDAPPKASPAP